MTIELLLNYNITKTKDELDNRATEVYNYLGNVHTVLNNALHKFRNVEGYKLQKQDIIKLYYNIHQIGIITTLLNDPSFNITANESRIKDIKQRIHFINSEWGEVLELQNQKTKN